MIAFYNLWSEFHSCRISESSFVEEFLNKSDTSIESLLLLDLDSSKELFMFFLNLDIDEFINKVGYFTDLNSADVPQYSSLEVALISLPLVLENLDTYQNYKEIGKMLINTKEDLARMKYGENHSKIAFDCSYVDISKINNKSSVKITNFGKASTYFNKDDVFKVSALMLCRNRLVQNIIYKAKIGKVSFAKEVSFLSKSTLERRKSNVKSIVELIFSYSKNHELFKNIEW